MPDVFKKLLILFWHAGFQQKLMKIQQNCRTGKRMLRCIGENKDAILPECLTFEK